jgi:hypothetical protein
MMHAEAMRFTPVLYALIMTKFWRAGAAQGATVGPAVPPAPPQN